MNTPEFITFTGADDQTSIEGMIELSEQYPIEWGILFSPKRQGSGRYPTDRFVDLLLANRTTNMKLAAHLCGGDAREVIERGSSQHDGMLRGSFNRAQINTADQLVQPTLIAQWADFAWVRAILQCRGNFPEITCVDVLFDASGGRGISPTSWPRGLPGICGYAGGLSPLNVAAAVTDIGSKTERYWIDMESGVRDEADRFSLTKCRAVCEAVYGPASAARNSSEAPT